MRKIEDMADEVASLEKDLYEFKTAQPLGGDSWLFYRNVASDSTWDVNVVLAAAATRRYKITFTPDEPDKKTAANLTYFSQVLLNGGFWALMPVANSDTEWWFYVRGGGLGISANYKFIVSSTQDGTVSFVVA